MQFVNFSNMETTSKKANHGKKFRLEGSQSCAICLDDITEGIILHKTQRQTHKLCFNCGETYIVSQLKDNVIQKNYIHTICCSATFDGEKRNRCKMTLDVTKLQIPDSIESVHSLIAKITVLTMPGATACLNKICENVILVPDNTDVAICPDCKLTWCQKCKVTPYHNKMSCQQYKFMDDSSPGTQQIKDLIVKGKIKLCSTCNYGIERNQGCNKVTCTQCKNAMCWLCNAGNIDYNHFQKGNCNQRLFDF